MNVFPSFLPGLGWSVFKIPNWGTRMQRAVSGRELRTQDFANPIWNFRLTLEGLRDKWDTRAGPGVGAAFPGGATAPLDELRTLLGFFNAQQGATIPFLFTDPSDSAILGQRLPAATSTATSAVIGASPGSNYSAGDIVYPAGGTGILPAAVVVSTVDFSGAATSVAIFNGGSYTVIPTGDIATTGGNGSGLTIDLGGWATTVQLVRTMSTYGFTENIIAPNLVSAIYYGGAAQSGWSVGSGGLVNLPAPFTSAQPVITADFTYYFLVRFTKDQNEFENFYYQLWQLRQLDLTSVVL